MLGRLALGVVVLCVASPALAHHVAPHALGYAEPRTSVVFATEYTSFHLGGERGRFVGEGVRATFLDRFWGLTAGVPLYSLASDSGQVSGFGDPMVGGLLRVVGNGSKADVWLGTAFELPLGNDRDRLANGHFAIVPSIYGAWSLVPERTIVRGTVAAMLGLGRHEHATTTHEHADGATHEHEAEPAYTGSFTQPHGSRELRYSVGLLQYVVPTVFGEASVLAATVFDDKNETLASAQWMAGVVATRGWIITGAYSHHLFGERRFDHRITFASQVLF